jgi:2-isopropylmalate synthase
VKLAKLMDESGVAVINVGFPALSDDEKRNVSKIVNESFEQAKLTASAEPTKASIDACLECGIKEVTLESPINGLNLQYRYKITKKQALQKIVESIAYCKDHGAAVNFMLMDGTRTAIDDIIQVFQQAAEAGVARLGLADSVGFIRPLSMKYLISHVCDGLSESIKKKIPMSIHCHNDFGLASANTLAAMEEGVSYMHTCIAGFGERAGIAPFEEVVTSAELLYNIDTGIDLGKIARISQTAEKAFALPIQFHKPIIGENIFAHEVEDDVEEMLAHPLVFEPFPPEIVGRETTVFIGRNTGQKLIQEMLEKAGIRASPRQMDELFRRVKGPHEGLDKGEAQMTYYQVKKLMKELQKGYAMDEFWRMVEQVTRQKPKVSSDKKTSTT